MSNKIDKYFKVTRNTLVAKEKCRIQLDPKQYKFSPEEVKTFQDEKFLVMTIPGYFEIQLLDSMDTISFTLPYEIELVKNNIVEQSNDRLILEYSKDDIIFIAQFVTTNTNIRTIESVIENGVKYLNDDIYETVINIYKNIKNLTPALMVNFEAISSMMYVIPINGEYYPLRISGKEYSAKYVVNAKNASHRVNNLTGFAFGYTNDYLLTQIVKKDKKASNKEFSYIENMISGNYHKLKKE